MIMISCPTNEVAIKYLSVHANLISFTIPRVTANKIPMKIFCLLPISFYQKSSTVDV